MRKKYSDPLLPYDFHTGELLLIDKPYGWTSFQAVNKVRHAIKNHPSLVRDGNKSKPKVGHAGTLDPLATGLLILCTGKKTRDIASLMGMEKEYTGTIMLGATTPCFDLEKPIDHHFPTGHITDEMILDAAAEFTGTQMQVPPVYSAVMIGGRRAYDIARSGETAEIRPREVTVSVFEITRIAIPELDFRIVCSKGTYIRSLARDIGTALGSGGHLTALCRTRIGSFKLGEAVTPQVFSESLGG